MQVINRRKGIIEAASALTRPASQERQEEWPYPWVYPPPGSRQRYPNSIIAAPTNGVLTELLKFQVPDGFFFRCTGLLLTYIGTSINDAAQIVTWNFDVNIPTAPSATLTKPVLPSGYRVQDFGVVTTHLGSLDFGPWRIETEPLLFDPLDVLRIKVTTLNPFPVNPPTAVNFVTGIRGYTWPQNRS